MELLKHTLFINLDSRTDRLDHVSKELAKLNINGERVSAIKMELGAIGCTMSHIKCLQLAKERNYEQVFICEDDITFTQPQVFMESLNKFYDNKNIKWDVLIVGGNNLPPYQQIGDYCIRTFNCQTTTGYIVQKHMYDTFIQNFKESTELLLRTRNTKKYSLDIYWKRLQCGYFWYMIIPPTVIQREDYSDIEGRQVRYDWLMLDINKEWFVKHRLSM
jgi:GR25 family glycosyltransferase involved in LPS biosynthesis